MSFFYLLNGIIFLGFFSFIFFRYLKHYDKKDVSKIVKNVLILGFIYLLGALFSFLWYFNVVEYSLFDFQFVLAFGVVLQTSILFRIIYLFSGNKKLRYFFFVYLFVLGVLFFVVKDVFYFFEIISLLVSSLLFVEIIFREDVYRKVGFFGLFYSLVSLVICFFSMFNFVSMFFYYFFSGVLFFVFLYFLLFDLEKYPLVVGVERNEDKPHYLIVLGHIMFIIVLVNFTFIGTIAIHEFGHYGVSQFYDCEYSRIVFENSLFHTEILCSNVVDSIYVLLGGVLLPLLIAAVLFLLGGKFMKEVGLMMIGFNLVSISRDLSDLNLSLTFSILSSFIGAIFLIWGIMKLSRSRSEDVLF